VSHFNGSDYLPKRDDLRLLAQRDRVLKVMQTGLRFTLRRLEEITGDPPASISAQLRHLRKPRHGSHDIRKDYVNNGLYEYWLVQDESE